MKHVKQQKKKKNQKMVKMARLNQMKMPTFGRCSQSIRNDDIDIIKTNRWLKNSRLKAEAGKLIMAALQSTN